MSVPANRSSVALGEIYKVKFGRQTTKMTVQAPCANTRGTWYCATCDEFFQNNMSMWIHCDLSSKVHKLAWHCVEHGLETAISEHGK